MYYGWDVFILEIAVRWNVELLASLKLFYFSLIIYNKRKLAQPQIIFYLLIHKSSLLSLSRRTEISLQGGMEIKINACVLCWTTPEHWQRLGLVLLNFQYNLQMTCSSMKFISLQVALGGLDWLWRWSCSLRCFNEYYTWFELILRLLGADVLTWLVCMLVCWSQDSPETASRRKWASWPSVDTELLCWR